MKKFTFVLAALVIIGAMFTVNAQAYTIVPGGPGIAAFYGWEDFNFSGTGGVVDANVFFAVFAPGDSNNPYSTLYTYAYLVQNTGNSTAPISQFTVGLYPGFSATIGNVGSADRVADIWDNGSGDLAPNGLLSPFYQTDDNGVAPKDPYAGTSSVVYNFITTGVYTDIDPNQHSLTLLYTSPHPPGVVTGSLQDGGTSQQKFVPGPVPEPGTMLLLGMGILGLYGIGRKKVKA